MAKDKEDIIFVCKTHGEVEPIQKGNLRFCPTCHRLVKKYTADEYRRFLEEQSREEEGYEEDYEEEEEPVRYRRGVRDDIEEEEFEEEEEEEEFEPPRKRRKRRHYDDGIVGFEEDEIEDVEPIEPPEVEFQRKAIQFLEKNLPQVWGIEKKKIPAIISSIKMYPHLLYDTNMLRMHIKWLSPKVNEYHLGLILNNMMNRYRPLLERQSPPPIHLLQGPPQPQQMPYIPPPTQPNEAYPFYPPPATPNPPSPTPVPMPYTPQPPFVYQPPPPAQPYEEKKKRTYKVVVDGQVIEVDDYKEFLALKDWEERRREDEERREKERQKHELEMMKLKEEIKRVAGTEDEAEGKPKTRSKMEDEIIKVLNSRIQGLESMLNQLRKEREEFKHKLDEMEKRRHEEKIRQMEEELARLREYTQNPFKFVEEYEQQLRHLGYARTGKSLIDVLDKGVAGIQDTIKVLAARLPAARNQQVKYTEEERLNKLRGLKSKIRESEEMAEIEEGLIKAAEKYYKSRAEKAQP